jgi:hypothetical protein
MKQKKRTLLKSTLGANSYKQFNVHLARALSKDAALVLSHFIDIQNYENMPDEFYQQKERIMYELSMTKSEFDNALKILINSGCVSVVKKGLPAKNHYTLHDDRILDIMSTEYSSTREPTNSSSGEPTNTQNKKHKIKESAPLKRDSLKTQNNEKEPLSDLESRAFSSALSCDELDIHDITLESSMNGYSCETLKFMHLRDST